MWLDQQGRYYEGAQHPYGSNMFPKYAFDMMKPLMEAQEYINSFQEWRGEKITIDLDAHRHQSVGMPFGSIHKWITYCYPDMQGDLSEAWIHVSQDDDNFNTEGMILIGRSSRYHNPWVNYFFLKDHADKLMFTGMKEEHEAFQKEWGFELPLLEVKDFYELAVAMKSCKAYIGNQSFCFALTEAMKINRALEVCDFAPNVIPIGGNHAHDFRFQHGLDYYFKGFDTGIWV